ncbi:hypothetical protein [Bradyrhizobium vignae]|uniref:hypothetical protein n=1 Tax=Bradyrhizobium vignae TaxID=1549949 RepID=UPI000EFF117B|nr:hypothetical protein [Bradyrhizobium vignae]
MLTCGARQQALTIRNKVFQAALSTAMLSMMTTAAAALDQDRRYHQEVRLFAQSAAHGARYGA